MQGINEHIIKFNHTHRTSVQLGDNSLEINPFFEQPKHINRIGIVVSKALSEDSPIEKGDQVLIVHTILLNEVYNKTGRIKSHYLIDQEKGYYRFANSLVVMYRKDKNDSWKCNSINIMVKPIKIEEKIKEVGGLLIPDHAFQEEKGYKGNEKQKGIVAFDNPKLNEMGVFKGDIILFKKDREYEFDIDGETYYHMENNDVLMKDFNREKIGPEPSDAFC